ncbi:MAG TPA: hypothetical protein DCF68_19795, partial [Cyanothece sp. UBA12306]|nr:hypothetical protein [Cyanothece sp. UBA12306]
TFEAFPVDWAMIQNNLGNVYSDEIREDKAENLETAILSYIKALKVCTFEAFPQKWAMTQNNLAAAYVERIRGDKAENLETAILSFTEALKVYTFEAFPQQWAGIQNNLGNAYRDRIREDKAENLEQAITYCQEALNFYTFEAFPVDWATTHNSLANAYLDRIRGDKADNIETAIAYYQEAWKVRTFEAFPQQWATTQNNLGIAYLSRIRGYKADNIETAIAYYQEALKVLTFEAFPRQWATTQNNLGIAYFERIRGDKAENLERAILYYTEALKVRTFEEFPVDWAATHNNLGNAYFKRIRGYKADNIETAIASHQEALKVYTFETFPEQWAMTHSNLGIAYRNRIKSDNNTIPLTFLLLREIDGIAGVLFLHKSHKSEKAITCYQEALKVYTFEAFPVDWARIQNNLGFAYFNRIRGDKAENLERAMLYYTEALKVYTFETFPQECLQTSYNLGKLHYREKQWQLATKTYNTAIEAVENARLEALNPQSRQEVLSNAIGVFHRIVQAYLNLNQPEKALEYIERSKGRNLVELMTQKGLNPQNVRKEIIDKLAQLKQQVVNEQIRLQHQSINQKLMRSDNLTPYVQDHSYLKEYQQELDTFIAENITPYDPTFTLTQKVKPIPFKDIKSLTDESTCLLQWYITGEKILAFIVSANETVEVWQSSEEDRNELIDTLNNYLKLYELFRDPSNNNTEWKDKLPNLLQTFANTLHINEIISLIPETCQRLIIIPHWFLHILPLHALPINNSPLNKISTSNYPLSKGGQGGSILQDKYNIQYAPSCQLLQITKQRPLNQLTNLFAVQNPTKDLIFTDLEVNIISTLFNQKEIIAKDEATENAVTTQIKQSESHCYHFSCHGGFNPNNPLESALLLANEDELTLGEIFELDLKKSRLVVLSACETGLIDLNSISDEYIGLPAGFLFAGSSSVVSSLWTVSDLSTSFLMMKFYKIILDKTKNISVPVALKKSQNWLRNLTVEKYKNTLNNCNDIVKQNQQKLTVKELSLLMDMIEDEQYKIKEFDSNYKLFNNPFYWAAFTASGR